MTRKYLDKGDLIACPHCNNRETLTFSLPDPSEVHTGLVIDFECPSCHKGYTIFPHVPSAIVRLDDGSEICVPLSELYRPEDDPNKSVQRTPP